jgi:aminoglycoside 3-N-acetyltransferase
MSEADVVNKRGGPITREQVKADLQALGLKAGQTVLVHSALSRLGWVVGGPEAVILALLDVLGPQGTLMVPAHSSGNSEPSAWQNPPVPESWWQVIRDHMPAYHPDHTPTRMMGQIAEAVRNWPGAHRSDHPQISFAALGPNAETLTKGHTPLAAGFADPSPLGKLYTLDGYVLLLGVGHENNTSLHLAETRADLSDGTELQGAAVMVDGVRQWATWEQYAYDDNDFAALGVALETVNPEVVCVGKVGVATARLMRQRPLVDFAVGWLRAQRGG